ncbi:MAG TPA: hypothetical protein VHG52_10750 [Thermomicrobiales bacterium]|nr:hypothetical protein [Thermomicrobiales bacterium]
MDDPSQIRVLLLSEGRVVLPEGGTVPGAHEATWEILGRVRRDGESMAFVRAEMAGETWTALVRSPGLEAVDGSPVVTLTRQSEPHPPLSGWARFC